MRYVRTQIYLEPDDHRRLSDEAHARGLSLTALIREIVSGFVRGNAPLRPEGFASIIGIIDGEPTDFVRDEELYREAWADRRYRKKMGEDVADRRSTPRRKR